MCSVRTVYLRLVFSGANKKGRLRLHTSGDARGWKATDVQRPGYSPWHLELSE